MSHTSSFVPLSTSLPQIIFIAEQCVLICSGSWTLPHMNHLEQQLMLLIPHLDQARLIRIENMTALDTAGALFLNKIMRCKENATMNVEGMSSHQRAILDLVHSQPDADSLLSKLNSPKNSSHIYLLGKWVVEKIKQVAHYLNFLGELVFSFLSLFHRPRGFYGSLILSVIQEVGCGSLAIVALMSFLIGVVLAYQLAVELQYYGAQIYVVEASGIALLREFSPLITAIVMAGKTTTAFAALIGTMKVNEEIDALQTMGISPMKQLVLPRLFALLIVLPLLVVWSDIWGVLGSMVMSYISLHIDFNVFLQRFSDMVQFKQYMLGMIKTPVFALIVALVGCFQGLQVSMSADSVGKKTTHAAVQSIFLIIIADAFFSVLFSWEGL